MEQFEEYFQIADLNRDGIINGAEARAFFHGASLPQHVLSQIWTYVNQGKTEYLSRLEFYNALKLVTVAQSKRELTPEIVTAALYGPASTMIPPPQINRAKVLAPQEKTVVFPGPSTNISNSQFRQVQPLSTGISQKVDSSVSSFGTSVQEQSHISWPKMTSSSVQSYVKVFMQMGKSRDGKITGMEARNLFLSWRLPMELLKQVWDLSDQDKDGMLSLREFCIALYLTEQHRGERQLPSVLPDSVMLDETLWSLVGPPITHRNVGCAPTTGITPAVPSSHAYQFRNAKKCSADNKVQESSIINKKLFSYLQHSSILGGNFVYGLCATLTLLMIINTVNNHLKIENNEKLLMDSRERIEFYRAKMQDLAKSLEKKCQEKERLISEIYSTLMIQVSSFREVQDKINELHQAILRTEQGGNADGILQVRADRIQSDIQELLKALPGRCKKQDAKIKSAAVIELSSGWRHGIPEIEAKWDEKWDKFDAEGLPCDAVLTDAMSGKRFCTDDSAFDAESKYSADEPKSPRVIYESATRKYNDNHLTEKSDDDDVTQRNFDGHALDSYDNENDNDNDSVWGFNAKDSENGTNEEKYLFGSEDFVACPERTATLSADYSFHRPFTLEL